MSTQTRTSYTLDSLMEKLGHKDGMIRQSARQSLVAMGSSAVSPLGLALRDSQADQVRWEAAKALGEIGDAKAIPALVAALEDDDDDVVWLAAEALNAFGMAAWAPLLSALIDEGKEPARLRDAAHHVFLNQRKDEYDDLLAKLLPALELGALHEAAPMAAQDILNRMRGNS